MVRSLIDSGGGVDARKLVESTLGEVDLMKMNASPVMGAET